MDVEGCAPAELPWATLLGVICESGHSHPPGASSWGTRKVSFSRDACHEPVALLQCRGGVRGSGAGGSGGCPGCRGGGIGTTLPRGNTPLLKRGGVGRRGCGGERSDPRPSESHWLAAPGKECQTGRRDPNPGGLRIRVPPAGRGLWSQRVQACWGISLTRAMASKGVVATQITPRSSVSAAMWGCL